MVVTSAGELLPYYHYYFSGASAGAKEDFLSNVIGYGKTNSCEKQTHLT